MSQNVFTKITAGLCFAVLIFGVAASQNVSGKVHQKNKVLRLHVIANSDSNEDIAIKNSLAKHLQPLIENVFDDVQSIQQAKEIAENNKVLLQSTAEKFLDELSCKQNVQVLMGKKFYETRVLDGVVYPRGVYYSVRIVIGKGQGHNWWCVLFSPLSNVGVENSDDNEKGTKIKSRLGKFISELVRAGSGEI